VDASKIHASEDSPADQDFSRPGDAFQTHSVQICFCAFSTVSTKP
jgi:hypothetical protein